MELYSIQIFVRGEGGGGKLNKTEIERGKNNTSTSFIYVYKAVASLQGRFK